MEPLEPLCDAVRVGPAGCRGTGIFALRAHGAGDVVFEERPAVAAPPGGDYYALVDEVLATPGLADALMRAFGHVSTARLDPDQLPARRAYLERAIRAHPGVPVPRVIGVVAALYLQTRGGVLGLYPTLNHVNHGCSPNARLETPADDPGAFRVVAARPIEPGDEITVQYVEFTVRDDPGAAAGDDAAAVPFDVLEPDAAARRAELMHHYGFVCQCAACAGAPATL